MTLAVGNYALVKPNNSYVIDRKIYKILSIEHIDSEANLLITLENVEDPEDILHRGDYHIRFVSSDIKECSDLLDRYLAYLDVKRAHQKIEDRLLGDIQFDLNYDPYAITSQQTDCCSL